jgi:NADPH:quinone reductase-like Zn-dependent oxidoreductase
MTEKVMEYTEQSGVDFILDAVGNNNLIIESGTMLAKYGAICSYAGRSGEVSPYLYVASTLKVMSADP